MQTFLGIIRFRHKPLKYSLYFGTSYLIICSFYIWGSGELAAQLSQDITQLKNFELYKGLIFVVLTSAFIFLMCFWFLKKLASDAEELLKSQELLLLSEHKAAAAMIAACMAHDANNVLSVISLRVEQLKDLTSEDQSKNEIVKKLSNSVEKLISMMTKLKSSGSLNLGKPVSFDLRKIVEESLDMVSHHKSLVQTKLELNITDDEFQYLGYATLFQQMVMNLVLNAAQAPRSHSETQIVKLSLYPSADDFIIDVEDDGVGIKDSEKEKIFTAFYTTKNSGTGLGLLSVKACVDNHLGHILVSNSTLGGAKFTITLPKTI